MTTTTVTAAIDRFGAADVLHHAERPVPAPGRGQAQVRVAAASVNPVDLQTRSGKVLSSDDTMFPLVLGWDAAGVIEQVGDDVDGIRVGDRVAAMTFQPADQNGTYAQIVNLDAGLLAPIPDGLGLAEAATLPLAGLTAAQLIHTVGPDPGATLLVNGATGAVGRLVVQLATRAGITVIAVAGPADRELVTALGATHIVDRGDFRGAVRDLYPAGVDAAVDMIGRETARAALASVSDGGSFATIFSDYEDPTSTIEPERGIRVDYVTVHPDTPELIRLLEAAARDELATTIERTYPLTEAAEAHRRQEQGGLRGKLVLLP